MQKQQSGDAHYARELSLVESWNGEENNRIAMAPNEISLQSMEPMYLSVQSKITSAYNKHFVLRNEARTKVYAT